MRARFIFSALAVACAFSACEDFDPSQHLDKLRVITVIADPPEIAAGETSVLTPIIPPEPLGGIVPTIDWAYCTLAPAVSAGQSVAPECVQNETAPYIFPLGRSDKLTFTMPKISPEMLGFPDATTGFYLPVRLTVRAGEQTLQVIERLRLAVIPPRNHRPTVTGIFTVKDDGSRAEVPNDQPADVTGDSVTLRAILAPGSAETYTRLAGDPRDMMFETVTEVVRMQWFSTAGEFDQGTTGEAMPDALLEFNKRFIPTDGQVIDVYVVAIDERGGSDYMHRQIKYRVSTN